jgi:hypothetical protein
MHVIHLYKLPIDLHLRCRDSHASIIRRLSVRKLDRECNMLFRAHNSILVAKAKYSILRRRIYLVSCPPSPSSGHPPPSPEVLR